MGLKTSERVVASWDNGAFVSIDQRHSLLDCNTFVGDLVDLIRQFGPPAKVEIKTEEDDGKTGVQNSGVRDESYKVSETQ